MANKESQSGGKAWYDSVMNYAAEFIMSDRGENKKK